jgi:hypothetical protein
VQHQLFVEKLIGKSEEKQQETTILSERNLENDSHI